MHIVSTEYHIEELLIVLSRLENDDLFDLKIEISFVSINVALVDIEH